MHFALFRARANWGWWASAGVAKERGLEFLETEIKGKTELEMGGNLKKEKTKTHST